MATTSGISDITSLTGISVSDMGAFFLLLAAYLFGVMCGLVAAVSRAAWLEQRLSRALRQTDLRVSFTSEPPGPLALGARTVLSLPILARGFVSELPRQGTSPTAHGKEEQS